MRFAIVLPLDVIASLRGNDSVHALATDDLVYGGEGNNVVFDGLAATLSTVAATWTRSRALLRSLWPRSSSETAGMTTRRPRPAPLPRSRSPGSASRPPCSS
jgi:hypothetical protein